MTKKIRFTATMSTIALILILTFTISGCDFSDGVRQPATPSDTTTTTATTSQNVGSTDTSSTTTTEKYDDNIGVTSTSEITTSSVTQNISLNISDNSTSTTTKINNIPSSTSAIVEPTNTNQTTSVAPPTTAKENQTTTTTKKPTTTTTAPKPTTTVHQHKYTNKIFKEATCIEKGKKEFRCECGHYYYEDIPAKEHSFGEWKVIKQPTQTEDGLAKRTCKTCQYQDTKTLPKLALNITVTEEQLQKISNEFLRLVNEERKRVGASELTMNSVLDSGAQTRSEEIISCWSHTRPNGEAYYSVIDRAEYKYISLGENLCMTSHVGTDPYTQADKWTGSSEQIKAAAKWIFRCFQNSPSHYANLVSTSFEECGIGISFTIDEQDIIPMLYVSHIFGSK